MLVSPENLRGRRLSFSHARRTTSFKRNKTVILLLVELPDRGGFVCSPHKLRFVFGSVANETK